MKTVKEKIPRGRSGLCRLPAKRSGGSPSEEKRMENYRPRGDRPEQ